MSTSMPQEFLEYASYVVPIIPRELLVEQPQLNENNGRGTGEETDADSDVLQDDKDGEILLLRKALNEAQEIIRSRQQQPRTLGGGYVDKILNEQLNPSRDQYEAENRRLLLADVLGICGQQLGISKAELRDSVSAYRQLVKETILTREAERSSHIEQNQAIEQILADMIEVSRIHESEKATLERKIMHLIEENDSKEKTINQLKHSLREAVRSKAVELQKVLDAHARQKAQHARELARLGRAHDDNLVDHETTRQRRDELLAQLLAARAEIGDLNGRLDGANRLISDIQDQLKNTNAALAQARDDAKRKEGELKAALLEAKRQVEDLARRNPDAAAALDAAAAAGNANGAADGVPSSLNLKLGKALDDNLKLKNEVGKLAGEVDNLKEQLSEAKPAIDRANAARDAAVLALNGANKRIDGLQRELDDKDDMYKLDKNLMGRKLDELGRDNDRLKDHNKLLGRQLDKALGDHALELASITAKHNNELGALDDQIGALKDKNRDLALKLEDFGGDIGSFQHELNDKDKLIGDLEDDLSKERRRSGELGNELKSVRRDLDDKRKQLSNAILERDKLAGDLDSAKETIADNERQLGLLGSTINHLNGEMDRTKAKLNDKGNDPDAHRRADDLARQLENANKRIAELQRELAELKRATAAALAAKDQELREAADALAAANAQITQLTVQRLNPDVVNKLRQLAPLLEGCKELSDSLTNDIKHNNVSTTTTTTTSAATF